MGVVSDSDTEVGFAVRNEVPEVEETPWDNTDCDISDVNNTDFQQFVTPGTAKIGLLPSTSGNVSETPHPETAQQEPVVQEHVV